jgi:hypothetical protein
MVGVLVAKLEELDTVYFFAEPVTDEQAPTYRDRIAHPMDLSTISKVYVHIYLMAYIYISDLTLLCFFFVV